MPRFLWWACFTAVSLTLLTSAACRNPVGGAPTYGATAASPTDVPALEPFTPIPVATATSIARPPSPTPHPTEAPTLTPAPSPTPRPSSTPSPTTIPTRDPLAPPCPATSPGRPAYTRREPIEAPWPTPRPDLGDAHFWLTHPFAGGGRLLINADYPYGWDVHGRFLFHNAVDLAEPLGTPIRAVADGVIVYAGSDADAWFGWRCDWYGQLVILRLDDQWQGQDIYILYGHVLEIRVTAGERVDRHQPLAEVGFGGVATVPHLHLEVRIGENRFDSTRNPLLWFDPGPGRGILAGRLVDTDGRAWAGVGISVVGGPEGELRNTWSYLGDPQSLAGPDEIWAENFVFGDLRAGDYRVQTEIRGQTYSATVSVPERGVATVEIVTSPDPPPADD